MRNVKGLFISGVLLLGLGVGTGAALQGQAQIANSQSQPPAPVVALAAQASTETQLFRNIYTQVNPSVVSIQVRIPSQSVTTRFGQRGQSQPYQMAAGLGFIYDKAGHIVTNAHVVQGADTIEVTFSDGNMMHAKLTGIDLDSDLAVIQVQGDVSHYTPVTIADSDTAQVGDQVVAIGNPFEEAGTMTNGIVSALHRTVQGLHTSGTSTYSIPDAIQTDAALNPGNSGGPLLNESGQVIGVNEQIEAPAGQSSGISFAISSNLLRQVVPDLIQNGSVNHAYLGIGSTSLTLDLNASLNLPDNTRGALVTDVSAGSPAQKGGLQAATTTASNTVNGGDVIIAIDKQQIHSSDDLIAYLMLKAKVGQTVTLTVLRNGTQRDVSVNLTARPA